MEDVPHGNITYSELTFLLLTSCVANKKSFVMKRLECCQSVLVHLLAGISSFKEGIDRLCECCGHRKCVLSTHCERTGSSGAAWSWDKYIVINTLENCWGNFVWKLRRVWKHGYSLQVHFNSQTKTMLFLADIVDGKKGTIQCDGIKSLKVRKVKWC